MGSVAQLFGIILAFLGLIFIASAPFDGDLETDIIGVIIGLLLLGGGIYEIVQGGKSVAKEILSEPPPVMVRERKPPQNRANTPDPAPSVIYQKEIQKEIICCPANIVVLSTDWAWTSTAKAVEPP